MLIAILTIIFGIIILATGGESLLRGAVRLSVALKLTPAVIGLTVVAAGTSVPELAVSVIAAVQGKPDITIGNVIGSNIFNIAFILGAVSIYRPIFLTGNTLSLEYPVLLIVTILFHALVQDGSIGQWDGSLLVLLYIGFIVYLVRLARSDLKNSERKEFDGEIREIKSIEENSKRSLLVTLLYLVVGIILLGLGADLTVSGAVRVGEFVGMSERLIGLTIVAAGTGLPEVVTSFVSSYRGRNDVAIANIIGSNLFNTLIILGLPSLISPLDVPERVIFYDNLWLLGITILLYPMAKIGSQITRGRGIIFLVIYGAYLCSLI